MNSIAKLALSILLLPAFMLTAQAGSVTTTKTTTVITTTTSGCPTKHYKKAYKKVHKKHHYSRCNSNRCSRPVVYDNWDHCPGGAYNCYWDLQGVTYNQSYYPISYENNVKYACLESEDPASCS